MEYKYQFLIVATIFGATMWTSYGQSPIISPLVIEGREGDAAMFTCDSTVPGGGVNLDISVFDEDTNAFIGVTSRLQRLNIGALANFTYGPLMAADNNTMFRCTSPVGATSQIAVISVIFSPMITRASPVGDPIRVREGVAVTVALNVSANPQPNSYEWTHTRNDMQQIVMNDDRITVSLNSILFNPTSRVDSGAYRLVANNSAGSGETNFTFDVQYPPEFPAMFVTPNTFNCSDTGEVIMCVSYPGVSATFFCGAAGNPQPTVIRSESGVSDQSNIDLTTGSDIAITSVTADNAGTFTCMATSEVLSQTVTITRMIRLYVGGTAQPLSEVTATISGGNVVVTWSYDNSVNAVPAQYFVATVSQNGMQIGSPFINTITNTSITLPQALLKQGETYTVSIFVRNLQGDSESITELFIAVGSAVAISMSYLLSVVALMVTALLF